MVKFCFRKIKNQDNRKRIKKSQLHHAIKPQSFKVINCFPENDIITCDVIVSLNGRWPPDLFLIFEVQAIVYQLPKKYNISIHENLNPQQSLIFYKLSSQESNAPSICIVLVHSGGKILPHHSVAYASDDPLCSTV